MKHLLPVLLLLFVHCPGLQAQVLIEQDHWPDGTLRSTTYSESGRTHFITYHQNGRVNAIGAYRQGKRDGVWKRYNDAGVLLARAAFRDGSGQGVWEFRTDADAPLGRLAYENGLPVHAERLNEMGEVSARADYR